MCIAVVIDKTIELKRYYTLDDIFIFEPQGKDEMGHILGKFKPTGIRPKFMDKLINNGIKVSNEVFWNKQLS